MRTVASKHPPGLVGYITGGVVRFYEFIDSLEITEIPEGSHQLRAQSCNPVNNCNSLIYHMPKECEWLWLLGDDHTWHPKLLLKLLDNDVDLCVPIVPRRVPPFLPVVYAKYVPALDGVEHDKTRSYSWQELQDARQYNNGLLPIEAAGSAGMLVRRPVWEAIEEAHGFPWFRIGTTGPDSMAEDLDFTWKASKMGFDCVVDCNAPMAHLVTAAITPVITKDNLLEIVAHIYGRNIPIFQTYEEKVEEYQEPRPTPTVEIIE